MSRETSMPSPRTLVASVILASVLAIPAGGQSPGERRRSDFARRFSGSLGAWLMQPTGELRDNIGNGIGFGGASLFRLDHTGIVALRADIGLGGYGQESKRVPLSPTVGGRVQVDVVTRNYIAVGNFGPQLTVPSGVVRPYVNAGVGFQAFFTESDVEDDNDSHSFASTTNQSDWTPTFAAGGGLYVPLPYEKCPVLLDFGFTWYTGGRATYLKPGSIEDLPNSQIRITPLESATSFMLFRVGVKIGR